MPRLETVWVWGDPGDPGGRNSPDSAAYTAASQAVCELLSESLRAAAVQAARREVRFFCQPEEARELAAGIVELAPREGPIFAEVVVPTGFADEAHEVQSEIVLNGVCDVLQPLAAHCDWGDAPLATAAAHVRDADYVFTWTSEPKSNRARTMALSLQARIDQSGAAQAWLTVSGGGRPWRSEPVELKSTVEEFRRAGRTLRWIGGTGVACTYLDLEVSDISLASS